MTALIIIVLVFAFGIAMWVAGFEEGKAQELDRQLDTAQKLRTVEFRNVRTLHPRRRA